MLIKCPKCGKFVCVLVGGPGITYIDEAHGGPALRIVCPNCGHEFVLKGDGT